MNYLPTWTSRLVMQHLCKVSYKFMQGCRKSWEDELKCVKILSIKGHKCQNLPNMNYIPTCTSRLVVQHLYQVSFISMQGYRRSWEEKLWWDGRTEWRKDGQSKHFILWRGHKNDKFLSTVGFEPGTFA